MVRAPFTGTMALATRVISVTMTSQVKAAIPGAMDATTLATGRVTRCMVKVSSSGPTDGSTRVVSSKTVNTASECWHGMMEENTRAHGLTANRMASVFSRVQQARNSAASGKRASLCSSLRIVMEPYLPMRHPSLLSKTDEDKRIKLNCQI